jgi:DNA-binding transcriptional MerR regulator
VTTYTVGQVARLAGVSVRTLHHYDALGLLVPSSRGRSGYRRYDGGDLERLQQVLVWRRLGFGLDEVAALLDDPGHDRVASLLRQRDLIDQQVEQLQAVRALLDRTLTSLNGGTAMTDDQLFDGLDPLEWNERTHGDEVRARWGDTDAYRESARRTARYGTEDWARLSAESEQAEARLADLMVAGVPADDPAAMDAAEAHRLVIDRWFYPCSPEMHAGLGDMYVADERFAAHYDQRAPGLAAYVRDAILANAVRALP